MPKPPKNEDQASVSEQLPDAWERFEKAVDTALHTKPKHQPSAKPKAKKK